MLPFNEPSPLLPIAGLSLADGVAYAETMFTERTLDDVQATALSFEAFEIGMAHAARNDDAIDLIRAAQALIREG